MLVLLMSAYDILEGMLNIGMAVDYLGAWAESTPETKAGKEKRRKDAERQAMREKRRAQFYRQ